MRAVTIPVSAQTGVAGFVFPGDHIDLVLTQTVQGEDSQPLYATETILRNLRVLARDQSSQTEMVDGKAVVKESRTVTLEVTPRMAEKIAVSQTIGALSLSLRSLADNEHDLELAIASGAIKIPEGATKEEEDRLLTQALNRPIEGVTTYMTGGDVSRFQRKTLPQFKVPGANTQQQGFGAAPNTAQPIIPSGPSVRVSRGKDVIFVPVGK